MAPRQELFNQQEKTAGESGSDNFPSPGSGLFGGKNRPSPEFKENSDPEAFSISAQRLSFGNTCPEPTTTTTAVQEEDDNEFEIIRQM